MTNKLALALVVLFLFSLGYYSKNLSGESGSILKISFPVEKNISDYDPTNISFAPEYVLLQNLYSTLVQLSPKTGEVTSGLASKYWWEGNSLYLKINEDMSTASGYVVSAMDVSFSLKRYIKLSKSKAFKNLICPEGLNVDIALSCNRISVQDNILELKFINKTPSILQMLSGVDFSIVPIVSVDQSSLNIIDYKNTTGPFYFDKEIKKGQFILKANHAHYQYHIDMPQTIELVPCDIRKSCDPTELYKSGSVDMITGADNINSGKLIEFSKEIGAQAHKTINLQHYTLTFTAKGRARIPKDQRHKLGVIFKEVLSNLYSGYDSYKPTDQLFPAFSDGSLSPEQVKTLNTILQSEKISSITNKVKVGLLRIDDESLIREKLKAKSNKIEIESLNKIPNFRTSKGVDTPDAVIGKPDTGFVEDFGLVSYFMKLGLFGLSPKNSSKWLKKYMSLNEKAQRMKMLKALHLEVLADMQITPLVNAPFVSLVRPNWSLNFSPFIADNQLWLIRKN